MNEGREVRRIAALLVCAIVLFGPCLAALAAPPFRIAKIGWLAVSAGPTDAAVNALRDGLHDFGYVEGQNYRLEHRSAGGHLERLPQLADELVQAKVDVILTATNDAIFAAARATQTIPIVAVHIGGDDPTTLGLVQSLNRPGGNVTGLTVRNTELVGKRLELLKELVPALGRLAVFSDSFGHRELGLLKQAAQPLGVQLRVIDLSNNADLRSAFLAVKAQGAEAVMVLNSPVFYVRAGELGAMALENRVPLVGSYRSLIIPGGLLSYSTDVADAFHRSAYFVDRILNGTRPDQLPYEQTATVRLVVNAKAARVLAISIPQSVLLRADEVIR
jgi:putative tryptophan/tyrosine transport system substrate-binding protein